MLGYKRSARVAELLIQEISKGILNLKKPPKGLVTITDVKLTDDLLDARVFYSVFGSDEDIRQTRESMKEYVPQLRHHLAQSVNMRRTPRLVFVYDETSLKAAKIFELLHKIESEEGTPCDTEDQPNSTPKKPKK